MVSSRHYTARAAARHKRAEFLDRHFLRFAAKVMRAMADDFYYRNG